MRTSYHHHHYSLWCRTLNEQSTYCVCFLTCSQGTKAKCKKGLKEYLITVFTATKCPCCLGDGFSFSVASANSIFCVIMWTDLCVFLTLCPSSAAAHVVIVYIMFVNPLTCIVSCLVSSAASAHDACPPPSVALWQTSLVHFCLLRNFSLWQCNQWCFNSVVWF